MLTGKQLKDQLIRILVLMTLTSAGLALGPLAERGLILVAGVSALMALFWPTSRCLFLPLMLISLLAASLGLVIHLAQDHFHYAYVWLYSAPELPLYLKISNFWGGEEGTLLLLALLAAVFGVVLCRHGGWGGTGALLLAGVFSAGALYWHPFSLTTAEQLAHAPYQGMNAHLTEFWMAIHPPLIFLTYMLLVAPFGAAVEALVRGTGQWARITRTYGRLAWLVLSLGLASGMWWAYGDYFYGQIWHWDPVQTATFVVWCLLTGLLHGLRLYHPERRYARLLPFLSLLTAAACLSSMLVTRNGLLISSHRYLGETSIAILAGLSLVLVLTAFVSLALSCRRTLPANGTKTSEARLMITLSIYGFFLLALIGCYFLGEAYLRALWDVPKDKPPLFFKFIASVSPPDLVALLKEQHKKWAPDLFALNDGLLIPAIAGALIGGHRFLPAWSRHVRWGISLGVIFLMILMAEYVRPLEYFYDASGTSSVHTRRNFYELNMLLVGVVYFCLACLVYAAPIGVNRRNLRAYYGYVAPVGLIHMGMMIALFSALCATILDSTSKTQVSFPQAFHTPVRLPGGYLLDIAPPQYSTKPDGIYIPGGGQSLRALTNVRLSLSTADRELRLLGAGQTLYRDERRAFNDDNMPIRQYCEMMDYRFARLSRGPEHILAPYIYRGPSYDLQVWLPSVDAYGDSPPAAVSHETAKATYTIVIRKYPMMTWLWLGLALSLVAGIVYCVVAWIPRSASNGSIRS
ncbi:cytochrome c biogenesis protein CcsA [Luteithermobacter gelatinilyticus]|uniref:cytochrome c biogenesis protein CcsA n=1 Tax=Luteithermobacter gelatinilyticus TaxID=2582913 RepID=UPI001105F187|nr:cytochrome c biogenesis protein CcsA [Luteithermobacter gelatinilyticus]